jgi:hypothetical protein
MLLTLGSPLSPRAPLRGSMPACRSGSRSTKHTQAEGTRVFRHACAMGLEALCRGG